MFASMLACTNLRSVTKLSKGDQYQSCLFFFFFKEWFDPHPAIMKQYVLKYYVESGEVREIYIFKW